MSQDERVALKFAYDGASFLGFQRQPEGATVEGALVHALARVGAISSPRECGYRSSSRTDRGVSALGNIVSFRTSFPLGSLCSAINSEMEDVWAFSAVKVPDGFNPRAARQRWYRYHLPRSGQDPALLREVASRFVGVHDFSGYARKDDRNPVRRIDSIDVSDSGMFYAVDFRAESFLWNMVRRIVWMMNEGSSGRMDLESMGPEAGKRPVRVGLAPAEYLVLMDIDCGIGFPVDPRAAVGIRRAVEARMRRSAMALAFAEELGGRACEP
ncbi:MAG: tRNA pseudouridine(38-40) synthase TruA [Candidatus Thermoplasmatota archaeon]